MKNLIALLFLLSLGHDSWGQQTNDLIKYRAGNRFYYKYANWFNPEADSNYAKMGVVSVRQSHYEQNPAKSRKKHLLTRETWFDSLGKETKLIIYNKKDNERVEEVYSYAANGKITEVDIRLNDKPKYKVTYTYDSSGKMVEYAFQSGKDLKLKTFNRMLYQGDKIYRKWIYKRDTQHYDMVYEYSYDNDTGRLLRIELKDARGKVKYKWDYSCNPSGSVRKKDLKRESRICKSRENLDNGHRRETWIDNIAGENYRYIYEYDEKDRLLLYEVLKGKYGDLLYVRQTQTWDGDTMRFFYEVFNEKTGTPLRTYAHSELANGNWMHSTDSYYNKRGKLVNSYNQEYVYNGTLLVFARGVNPKHKSEALTQYEYTFTNAR